MTTEILTALLPERDEMLRRLLAFDNDPHMTEQLYPKLLKAAGEKRTGLGFVLLVALAIADYTEGMPAFIARTVQIRSEDITRAVLEGSPILADALAGLRDAGLTAA